MVIGIPLSLILSSICVLFNNQAAEPYIEFKRRKESFDKANANVPADKPLMNIDEDDKI